MYLHSLYNYEEKPTLTDLNRILYKYYSNIKTQDYILTLKELLYDVCVEHGKAVHSEKEKIIVDGAISSVVILLLNCICTSELSIEETNELIMGFMQNGVYVTLTNRFGIDLLKNPFLS